MGAWGPLDPLWCLVGVLAALCGIVLSKRTALWVRRLDERFLLAVNPTWERRWFLPPEHDTAHALQVPPFSAMLYDTTERTDARWPFGEPAPAAWRERIGQVQLIWPSGIGAAELGDEHELLLRAVVDEARAKRTDLEALDEAHALLADPARWCQGHAARAGDMPTDPCALQADRWCLLGALDKAGALMSVHLELARTLHLFEHGRLPAELDLAAATEALSDWNDADGRQHVQVLALILDTCARLTRELETGEVRS